MPTPQQEKFLKIEELDSQKGRPHRQYSAPDVSFLTVQIFANEVALHRRCLDRLVQTIMAQRLLRDSGPHGELSDRRCYAPNT